MADNTVLNQGAGGDIISTDDIGGIKHQMVKIEFGVDGVAIPVSTADPMPVQHQGALTVSGTIAVSNLPGTQSVSGIVAISNLPATQPVSGTIGVNNFPASQAISAVSLPLPTNAATEATIALMSAKLPATLGAKNTANSLAVNIASDQVVNVKSGGATGSAITTSNITTTSSTALALNTNRKGAMFQNEGASTVYLKFGATASITSYTVQIVSGAYYELPFNYTGILDAITATGTAILRLTELT